MFVKNRLIAMLVALFLIVPAWAMAETVTVDGIVYEKGRHTPGRVWPWRRRDG